MDSFLVEDPGDIFRGNEFVARRIYGIDADEVLQPIERVAFQLRKIVRRRRRNRRYLWGCGLGVRPPGYGSRGQRRQ